MKYFMAMFGLLCLLLCAAVSPMAAQDAPAAPVPCDADQVLQVVDLALPLSSYLDNLSATPPPEAQSPASTG